MAATNSAGALTAVCAIAPPPPPALFPVIDPPVIETPVASTVVVAGSAPDAGHCTQYEATIPLRVPAAPPEVPPGRNVPVLSNTTVRPCPGRERIGGGRSAPVSVPVALYSITLLVASHRLIGLLNTHV